MAQWRRDRACDARALRAAVDTTAAGDSFNAGFFATEQLSLPMDNRLTLAARVAGRVIAQRGALVPVRMEDILSSAA